MLTLVNFKSTEKSHVFNSKDYPFWKNKMFIHVNVIDEDLWRIIEERYVIADTAYVTLEERKY